MQRAAVSREPCRDRTFPSLVDTCMAFLTCPETDLYVQTVLALKPGPLPTLCSRRLVDQGPLQGRGPQFAQTRLF